VQKFEIFKGAPMTTPPIVFDLISTDRKAQIPERAGAVLSKSMLPFFRIHGLKFLLQVALLPGQLQGNRSSDMVHVHTILSGC
jgi:hypothetical protein